MPTRTLIDERLQELRNELASGRKMMAELDQQRAELQATMLRISGAIQALQELLDVPTGPESELNRASACEPRAEPASA